MEGTITRRLSSTFNELDNQFKALYSKSDFNYVINRLKKFENKSNRASILAELFDMFKWTIVNKVDRKKEKNNTYWGQASIRLPGNWGGKPQGLCLINSQRIKIKFFFLIRRKHIISRMRSFRVIKPFNILKKRKFQLGF